MPDNNEDRAAAMNQAVLLASLDQQIKALVDSAVRTERTLEKLDAIGTTVTELRVIADANKQTFSRLFTRLEKLEASHNEDEQADARFHAALEMKANASDLASMGGRIDAFVSQFRGGFFVASVFATAVQGVVVGAFVYSLTHIQQAETALALLSQRVQQMQEAHGAPPPQPQPKPGNSHE